MAVLKKSLKLTDRKLKVDKIFSMTIRKTLFQKQLNFNINKSLRHYPCLLLFVTTSKPTTEKLWQLWWWIAIRWSNQISSNTSNQLVPKNCHIREFWELPRMILVSWICLTLLQYLVIILYLLWIMCLRFVLITTLIIKTTKKIQDYIYIRRCFYYSHLKNSFLSPTTQAIRFLGNTRWHILTQHLRAVDVN